MSLKNAATAVKEDDDQEDSLLVSEEMDKIGLVLAASRSEAIAGRQDSGIEDEWLEDEEYYEGIDDANRNEMKAWRGKPLGQATPSDEDKNTRGSTIFLNITRPYCDATSARMGDMLLPTDDKSWGIKPTPKPEMIDIKKGEISRLVKKAIEEQMPNDPDGQGQEITKVTDQLMEEHKAAAESAKLVEQQIWDWHVECNYHSHNRRVIEDSSKVGTGVLKGPIPKSVTKRVYKEGSLKYITDVKPVSMRVDYRNCYPDPACGESIHDGNYFWERDDLTRRKLQALIKNPDYIKEQILKCIEEGPQEATKEFTNNQDSPGLKAGTQARKHMFEIWYMHGSMKREDLQMIDYAWGGEERIGDYPDEYVHVSVTMVNNRVIKAQMSHLDSGVFPYDFMVWQRRTKMPWGIGIARQVRPAQRIIVGAIRHMMDNAGIAGGPMLFMNDLMVVPAEDPTEIKPWKIFVAGPDYEPGMDVKDAIQFLEAPMLQPELEAIVTLGLKFAEDITGLPLIMQGQTNQRTPQTLGGMQMQSNNGSTVLRRTVKNYDDMVTEPHVGRYYDHILEYSEDDELKGEFMIDALGSSALLERDMRDEATLGLGQYVMNPMFGLDPKKWIAELLKANKLDVSRFEYDDEEWRQIVEQMAQPQQDPRTQIAQMQMEGKQAEMQFNAQQKAVESDKDRALKMGLAEMEREFDIYLKEMGDGTTMSQAAMQAKESMAEVMVKLRAQLYMQGQDGAGGQLTAPPVEPTGRAPAGQAYAR